MDTGRRTGRSGESRTYRGVQGGRVLLGRVKEYGAVSLDIFPVSVNRNLFRSDGKTRTRRAFMAVAFCSGNVAGGAERSEVTI